MPLPIWAGREPARFFQFCYGYAELAGLARGAHVAVVSGPGAGVDAQEEVTALEEFRPFAQGMQVVEGQLHAHIERGCILLSRREVRGEQDRGGIQLRDGCAHRGDLAGGHRLETDAGRMGIGLRRVQQAIHSRERPQLGDGGLHRLRVVHVAGRTSGRQLQQRRALPDPPGRFGGTGGRRAQLSPSGTE
jgi:hypothetical protein